MEELCEPLAPIGQFITGSRQLLQTDPGQSGVAHRYGPLDASEMLCMAFLASSDVGMKRRWRPLEKRCVVRVANDTV